MTQRLACLLNLFSPSPVHTLQLHVSSISNVASFSLSVFPWGTEAQLSDQTDMSRDPASRACRCILYRGNRTSRAPRPKPKVFTQRAEGLNGWREPATSVWVGVRGGAKNVPLFWYLGTASSTVFFPATLQTVHDYFKLNSKRFSRERRCSCPLLEVRPRPRKKAEEEKKRKERRRKR